ncbi:MAG: adenosylcobinamide amidohydrolase [Verrucomicrobia bacterium]|nr:adenosylcobinamide amidohydrolase [Verrucomicrobiota bacterium]
MSDLPLFTSPFAELRRRGRHAIVELRAPALVLSTSHVNGGLRDDLRFLVNHQSCEPVKHQERFELITGMGQDGYHRHVCAELALDPAQTALMGTAAAMQYLGIVTHTWADLSVTAIVTAGVTGNAGSAGDAAFYDERNGTWERTTPLPEGAKPAGTHNGTINTLLIFSSPLSPSALTRAAMTMTEAKTSALLELAIGSKSSWRLATGTGTDQFAIATPREGAAPRTWTGKHTKAGELIGRAVREATLEALRWQNGLEPSYTRSIFHALTRFGLSEEAFKLAQEKLLSEREYQLLKANWNPVIFEPQLAAAAYAFGSVLDRILCGTLSSSSARESLINQAALMAAGLATQPENFSVFRRELIPHIPVDIANTPAQLLPAAVALANHAIALGWQYKWKN